MKEITYLKGDATLPQAQGTKIIAHICNDIGGWGKGFVLAISRRWSVPEKAYREWYENRMHESFKLGDIQLVKAEESIYVANMIAQHGIRPTSEGGAPIRYEAVSDCLEKLCIEAKKLNASVHMPRIGCGLAGGTWDRIETIIMKTLSENDIDVFVYDFE